jgi:hypothetical protein
MKTDVIEIDTNTDFIYQEQIYCSGYASGIPSGKPFAQSFIPSYPVRTRVELMLVKRFNPGDFTLSIRETLEGDDLVSVHMISSEIPEDISWKPFDFTDITVQLGRTYYIVCSPDFTEDYNMYYWYFGYNDPYIRVDAWIFERAAWNVMHRSGFPQLDFGFKTFGLNTSIPSVPMISGPITGSVGVEYKYQISVDDLDHTELSYEIEWGSEDSEIAGPFPAGDANTIQHVWSQRGSISSLLEQ